MKQPLSSSPELKPKLDALLDVLLVDNSIAATQPPFLIQRGSWISEKTHIQSDKYIYNYIYICDLTGETSCHESLPSFEGANAKCLGRIERLR